MVTPAGLGLFCALELVKDRETKEQFPPEAELGSRITQGLAENGILLRGGEITNIAPPLCVTAGEIDDIVSALDRVIGAAAHELGMGVRTGIQRLVMRGRDGCPAPFL